MGRVDNLAFGWLDRTMSEHSVVEARNQLSALIDRAEAGERVVITRHGQPVVELRAVKAAKAPVTKADMDWLRARKLTLLRADGPSLVDTLIQMRDEDRLLGPIED